MNETAVLIGSVAGAVLSLVFKYVPGLNVKWDRLEEDYKRMYMGAMLVLVAVVMYALSCWDNAPSVLVVVECSKDGLTNVLFALFSALTANQSVHAITPMATSVKKDRADRAVP